MTWRRSFILLLPPASITVIHYIIYIQYMWVFLNHPLHAYRWYKNAAARLLPRAKKTDHVTPILAALHWLPVHFWIQLKFLLFVFKALNGQAPSYLTDHLTPLSSSRSLRSSDRAFLAVPRSRFKTKSDGSFSIAAPRLWNQLPLDIRLAPSITTFGTKLKTHLYTSAIRILSMLYCFTV